MSSTVKNCCRFTIINHPDPNVRSNALDEFEKILNVEGKNTRYHYDLSHDGTIFVIPFSIATAIYLFMSKTMKIDAIKVFRNHFDCSLVLARDIIESNDWNYIYQAIENVKYPKSYK